MTVDTVVHRECLQRTRRWAIKACHRPVTSLALNLCYRDVDPVSKKHMGRQTPDSLPRDFLFLFTVSLNFLYLRILRLHGPMASHANRAGRPPGDNIGLDSLMTGAARKALCDVFLMWELDRLFNTPHSRTQPEDPRQHPNNDHEDQNNRY